MRMISRFALALSLIGIGKVFAADPATRELHFIQDDAQDYMVSKIYHLKYVQSNDIAPFVAGIVMRYNMNSSVGNIEYGADNRQLLTVTCPVEIMPSVDDFIAKVDRNIKINGKVPGDIIKGTGITRAVYRPKFRSGQNLLNVLVNSVIGEGPYGSIYAWDANSNQIYWKDNTSNTQYVYQFLGYLDRPAPQIALHFTIHEIRDSSLRDVGLDYVAWKNGPALNMLQVGYQVFSLSSAGSMALQAASGPFGGFLFAPQFDMSFIRLLEQHGVAKIHNRATLTVANSDTASYSIRFNPDLQNIQKSNNDQTSVKTGTIADVDAQIALTITAPIVNLHYGESQPGYPSSEAFEIDNYHPGALEKLPGTLFFGYTIVNASVVERNNVGAELIESANVSGNALIDLHQDVVLASWTAEQEVEQTIGVPFLMDIPVLKYLVSTTTTSKEICHYTLSCRAELLDGARPAKLTAGKLARITGEKDHE